MWLEGLVESIFSIASLLQVVRNHLKKKTRKNGDPICTRSRLLTTSINGFC